MFDDRQDQAAGLRRLFRRSPPMVAALYVTGRQRGEHAMRLARRLAAGQRVLLLDEGCGEASLAQAFGLPPEIGGDLLQVLDGQHRVTELLQARGMVARVSIAAAAPALPLLDDGRRKQLLEALTSLQRHAATVLVHADPQRVEWGLSPFVQAAPRRLIVAEASASGATESYALIKRLATTGVGSLHVAVAGARGRADANAFFQSLDALVRRHVGVPLAWLGEIERDAIGEGLLQSPAFHHPREPEMAFLRRLAEWGRNQWSNGFVGSRPLPR